jgi:hypothetical protein
MRRDDILRRLREHPFRPFHIRLSNGSVHFIQHPELVMVGGASVVLGLPRSEYSGPGDIDDYAVISLARVVQIDPVSELPSPRSREAGDNDGE